MKEECIFNYDVLDTPHGTKIGPMGPKYTPKELNCHLHFRER